MEKNVKSDFKILRNNKDLVYLNSSASSLKPDIFTKKLLDIYENNLTTLAKSFNYKKSVTTNQIEEVYNKLGLFLNCNQVNVIPTFGTTDGLNKIATSLISDLKDGDEIILGKLEHASNILPWVNIAKRLNKKIVFKWYELKDWKVDLEKLKEIISSKTKIMAVAHTYNTTGVTNDIKRIKEILGDNVNLVVDAAQSIGHLKIDIKDMNCDFLAFGAHKAFGPHSLGFVYIKDLDKTKPFNYGGDMNQTYSEETIELKDSREKFIAGTQDVPAIISFGTSIDYINSYGIENIEKHNNEIKRYAEELIRTIPKVNIINKNVESSNLFFEIEGVSGEDVAYHLIQDNIVVRSGSSCVKIKNNIYKQYKAIRASFHIYNTKEDVDKLYESLKSGGDFLGALFGKRETIEICK